MKDKRLVVLVLVLLELGLCAGMYSIVQATAANFSGLNVTIETRPTAAAEGFEDKRYSVDGPATLTVDNPFGAVRIAAGAVDEIAIKAHKQVWASTPEEAQAVLAALDLQTTQDGNAIKVQPNSPQPAGISFTLVRPSVDITITVPVTTGVNIHALSGGITLAGTAGDVELNASRGPVRVSNVKGNVTLQSDRGDVTAEHVQGQVQATVNSGTLRLSDIRTDGELLAKTSRGDVVLNDCSADSMVVQILRGRADLRTCTARYAKVNTGSGDISLSQVRADTFRLQAQRGNLTLDGASGSLWARADSGNISIKNGNEATLDMATLRGTISYAGSLGDGPHVLQSDSGDVRLMLPQGTALTVDLQTDRGQISSQFPVALAPGGAKNVWHGAVNGGGPALQATVHNGNILLDESNP